MANGTSVTCCDHTWTYYNETRTHLSLDKDAPVSRATLGRIGRPFWVDCITNMCRFDLRQAQAELDVAEVTAPRQLNGFYETWPILALVSERMG